MLNRRKPTLLLISCFYISLNNVVLVTAKSTIERCSSADPCSAMVGYTLYTDLKVSEVASLFQIDPIALLTANAIDISYPDVENHILPSQLFVKVPIVCSCVDGIRISASTHYKTRPLDTLANIADAVYGGLVSAGQLKEANSISDSTVLDVGQSLVVPLPCTCFSAGDILALPLSGPRQFPPLIVPPSTLKTKGPLSAPAPAPSQSAGGRHYPGLWPGIGPQVGGTGFPSGSSSVNSFTSSPVGILIGLCLYFMWLTVCL